MSSSSDSASGSAAPAHPEAAAFLARGQDLEQKATAPADLTPALASYDAAITLLRALPVTSLAARRDLAIALMHRGHAIHRQGDPTHIPAAVAAHREATTLLSGFSVTPDATTSPELAFNHRLNLAGSWVNVATLTLADTTASHRLTHAREAATQALALLTADQFSHTHAAAAELTLLAHRAHCDILGQLIPAVSDAELTRDLISEASDTVDAALSLARHCEQNGARHFRPLAARLYHFGAQLYRIYQPHFLAEFLVEHLDPEQSPGAVADDPVLYAIAEESINHALQSLQSPQFFDATRPAAARQLDTSRDLKTVSSRLATLRETHVPQPTISTTTTIT